MVGFPAVFAPERDECDRRDSLLAERPALPFSPALQRLPLLTADGHN
jgi:hypothetical protein